MKKHVSLVLALVLTATCILSCSKKESSSVTALSSTSILELPLLKDIPSGTLGFLAWNYDSPDFKEYAKAYQQTLSSKGASLIGQLKELALENESLKPVADISEWLISEKFIETDLSKPQPLKNGVVFFRLDPTNSTPGAGAYFTSRSNFDLKTKLEALKTKLSEQGIQTAPLTLTEGETLNGATAYTVEMKGKADGPVQSLYVVADSDKAAITTSQKLSEQIFQSSGDGKPAIINTAHFTRISKKAGISGEEITLAYADIEAVLQKFKDMIPTQNSGQDMPKPSEIPVQSALLTGSMKDSSLWTSAYLTLDENKGNVKQYTAQLAADQEFIPTTIDDKSVLSFGLAKNLIQVAKTALLLTGELNANPEAQAQLALLDKVDYLRLGLTQGDPGSLFPGIYMHVKSEESDKLSETLKTMLSAMIQSGQAPLTPWRDKDIAETKTSYSLSPLGIGAYVSSKDKSLFVASSEGAMSSLLKGKNVDNLDDSFGAASQSTLKEEKPVFISHFNGEKMADLITMAQGNLAIFTGGKNPVDAAQIEQIKGMGNVLWTLAFQDNAIIFHGIQRPAEKTSAAS